MQFSSAATFSHETAFTIEDYMGQKVLRYYPYALSLIGESFWNSLCQGFCRDKAGDTCKCIEEGNGGILPLSQRSIVLEGGEISEEAINFLKSSVDGGLQPLGVAKMIENIYHPLVNGSWKIPAIYSDGLVTIENNGEIKEGRIEIGQTIFKGFKEGEIISSNEEDADIFLSNAIIDFGSKKIILNQYGKYEAGQKDINCNMYSLEDNGGYSILPETITKDSINIYNFEQKDLEIPFSIGYFDSCSKQVYSQLKFKDVLNYLVKKVTNKEDSVCISTDSKFLVYYSRCSNFNEKGILRTQIGNINKIPAEMNPNKKSTFVLNYNRDQNNPLNNLLCASDKFLFKLGDNNPTEQKCLNIVQEGKIVNLYSTNEENIGADEIEYNTPYKGYYNLANLFNKLSEEDSQEYILGIEENNPRLDIIDSRNQNSVGMIKTG